jgi:hypothetical protein
LQKKEKQQKKDYLDFDLYEIPDKDSCVFLSVWYFEGTQIILESNGTDILELETSRIYPITED